MGIELHVMTVKCNSSIPRLRKYLKFRWGRGRGFLLKGATRFVGIKNRRVSPDIEQPLPGRNLIYLAYFLPKELEELSS